MDIPYKVGPSPTLSHGCPQRSSGSHADANQPASPQIRLAVVVPGARCRGSKLFDECAEISGQDPSWMVSFMELLCSWARRL